MRLAPVIKELLHPVINAVESQKDTCFDQNIILRIEITCMKVKLTQVRYKYFQIS